MRTRLLGVGRLDVYRSDLGEFDKISLEAVHQNKWLHHRIGKPEPEVVRLAKPVQDRPSNRLAKTMEMADKCWDFVPAAHDFGIGVTNISCPKIPDVVRGR